MIQSRDLSTGREFPRKPASLRGVDPSSLSRDQLLTGIPAPFVRDVLKDLAPRLLAGINCTSLGPAATPAPDKELPTHAECVFDPSVAPGSSPLVPTFLLALLFPARDPNLSPPIRILVPCHSLLYALASPRFPLAATGGIGSPPISRDSSSSTLSLLLPVIGPIDLPSLPAFSALHTFLHTRSRANLQHALMTKVPPTSRLPSPPPSPRLDPSARTGSSQSAATTSIVRDQLDREDALELLDKIRDVRATAIRLQISDSTLWEVMESSWRQIVDQIT